MTADTEVKYKLFFVGKSGVGKTSTVAKLSGNNLSSMHSETPGTLYFILCILYFLFVISLYKENLLCSMVLYKVLIKLLIICFIIFIFTNKMSDSSC